MCVFIYTYVDLGVIEKFSNKNCSGTATTLKLTALSTCSAISGTNTSYFASYETVPPVSGFIYDAYYSTSSCVGAPFAINSYYAGSCLQLSTGYAIMLIDDLATCSQYTIQMYSDSACSVPVGPVTTHFMSELGLSNSYTCSRNTNFHGYGFGKMSCSSLNPVGLVPYPKITARY